jgi:tRNA (cytidine/uridine-2'-O-)-methyltransferase
MFNIALFEPEIPPNTGNIIRLCANTGARLHLIHPVGFDLDDARLKRAGLDYHEYANITEHDNFEAFIQQTGSQRLYACSTRGVRIYTEVRFEKDDILLFGPETRGLPASIMRKLADEHILRIPMLASSRSLNLSNAVAIMLYEAWRQNGFTPL